MAAPKPCDRVWNGTRTVCGPQLLIPGLGKCGTNAIANYLALHPRVRLTNQSEVMFDPRDVSVSELVARHNPDVTPENEYVWIMKHPGLENRHASVLARRVRRAFPSASVALALCDPAQRAFRFFIYFLEHELRQHGQRVTFTKFAQVTLKRRYNATVEELYQSFWEQVLELGQTDERTLATILLVAPEFATTSAEGYAPHTGTQPHATQPLQRVSSPGARAAHRLPSCPATRNTHSVDARPLSRPDTRAAGGASAGWVWWWSASRTASEEWAKSCA